MQPLGAHMSISGGLELAFARGEEVGCTALQIFTKNASQWQARPISGDAARRFREAWQKSAIGPVVAHDAYLINLAAADEAKWRRSREAFRDELERCALLGIPWLVAHPGAHLGSGEAAGITRVAEALNDLLPEVPREVGVLLENTAGQGTCLGHRIEHLARIIDGAPAAAGRVGICLDTCHAFAAGYDLGTEEGYEELMAETERLVGLDRVLAFHLNDSKKGLASRVDRHEHVGEGAIGQEGFRRLLQDERFSAVPKILETPKGEEGEWDRRNLGLLRRLAGEG